MGKSCPNKINHYICKFNKESIQKTSTNRRYMKKHLFQIVLFLAGLTLFTSCMKDDPKNNETVFYGYQQIPNINEYMPQRLLYVLDSLNALHFGDEPPKIEGCILADSINRFIVKKVSESNWLVNASLLVGSKYYFTFSNQHKGISEMKYKEPHGSPGDYNYYIENSETDSTYYYIKNNESRFINDSIAPSYFKSDKYSVEDFRYAYIIGDAPYFTVYYYEMRDMNQHFHPLNAVIITGRLDHEIALQTDTISHKTDTLEIPIIKDLVWGCETMMYYTDASALNFMIQQGYQPTPGDISVSKNLRTVSFVDE